MSTSAVQTDASGTPQQQQQQPPGATLARALGWGSLGLGVPMTTMPGRFDRWIGVRDDAGSRAWTVAVGIRELAQAEGILVIGWPRPVGWLWSRVAGDVMDLTLLARAWATKRQSSVRLACAMGQVVAIGVADVTAATRMSRGTDGRAQEGARHVKASITVRQPPEEVYGFWHDFQNLPRFMTHVESVEATGDRRYHWKATAPAGRTVEWDAEVVEDRPNELIAWRTVDGGGVRNAGTVRFVPAPGGRGTEIHVDMDYEIPGGEVAATVAKLFGEEPQQQVKDDLRRFKQVAETGVVVRSEGSPEGPRTSRLIRQRPAQPLPEPVGAGM